MGIVSRADDRDPWFSPAGLAVVILGGAVGVALRAAIVMPLTAATGGPDGIHPLVVPAVTLAVNVLGSFLLGVVVGALGDRHPSGRLFLGTGVMGGFTTYSAFAVQSVTTFTASPFVGLALMAASVFAGVIAAGIGLVLGGRAAGHPDEIETVEGAE